MEMDKECENTFEIEFCFEDEECHDIDGEVLTNYLLLLQCFCKEKKCNYSISPPEKASYKQKANFTPQKGTRGLSVFAVDLIESFFEGTKYGTAENSCKAFGKNLSIFFKSVSENTKKVKSIILKQTTDTETKTKEIDNKEFYTYFIEDEEQEDKKQEKEIINVNLNKIEVASSGRLFIADDDAKKIKNSIEYQNIMIKFNKGEDKNNDIKEECGLFSCSFSDEKK